VLGYFGGAGGVVVLAVADKKGRTNQPLAEGDVDDRAFRTLFSSYTLSCLTYTHTHTHTFTFGGR